MISVLLRGACAAAVLSASSASGAAWSEKLLQTFHDVSGHPYQSGAGLVADAAGNLYGTTAFGGQFNDGTVFELIRPTGSSTAWKLAVLHSFGGIDGSNPHSAVVFDAQGNLIGTTYYGGNGYGVVYKLSPNGQGGWTETVLHAFVGSSADGIYPQAGVTLDPAGNIYGTTFEGGANTLGTAYRLAPDGQGGWTEFILHAFGEPGSNDGQYVSAGLIRDAAGNLYGTTAYGGASNMGTVYRLSPPAITQPVWPETILWQFGGADGNQPEGGLIFDSAGQLYGSTSGGGAHGNGAVFKLRPPAEPQPSWVQTVLFSFDVMNGAEPTSSLAFDAAGNLYGETLYGGPSNKGVVFEVKRPLPDHIQWTGMPIRTFSGANGATPDGGLIFDAAGNLYGTTNFGGGGSLPQGTVFMLSP
jgi:uncharacterized repeat protein (TIGR03803 family)